MFIFNCCNRFGYKGCFSFEDTGKRSVQYGVFPVVEIDRLFELYKTGAAHPVNGSPLQVTNMTNIHDRSALPLYPMITTYGLTHIALKVKNITTSLFFYQQVFGVQIMYQKPGFAQVQTPGSKDIIVFEQSETIEPNGSGIMHFGFRLVDPNDIEQLADEVISAGGEIKETGEFVPGEPYAFIIDPDGYEMEVWFEKIPPELSSFA